MIKKLFFLLLIIPFAQGITAQESMLSEDSLFITTQLGLRGRWQTGNLNQLSLMPEFRATFDKSTFHAEMIGSYHFLKVNGFNAINDFWTYGLYQHRPNKRIFPSGHSIAGFATSFKIDHSIVIGAGAGWNIYKKPLINYLQMHLYLSYLNFKHSMQPAHEAPAIGSLIRSNFLLHKRVQFRWELSSFHSVRDNDFWGGSNLFQLNFKIFKNLFININHQTYFNNQISESIEKLNTEMSFGFRFNLDNRKKQLK